MSDAEGLADKRVNNNASNPSELDSSYKFGEDTESSMFVKEEFNISAKPQLKPGESKSALMIGEDDDSMKETEA